MSTPRSLNLLFDLDAGYPQNRVLVKSFTDDSNPSLAMVARDQFILNLFPVKRAATIGQPVSTNRLPSGQAMIFTLKPANNLSGPAIALGSGFVEAQDGSNNYYYAATIAISLAQFVANLASGTTLSCIAEILVQDPNTGDEQSFQFPVTLLAPVYRGTESIPDNEQFAFWSSAEADARYGRMDSNLFGKATLGAGVGSYTATGLGLPFLPDTVLAWAVQNGGTAQPIFGQVDKSTITQGGFTINFSGLTPDTAHTIYWWALPAPSAFTNIGPSLRPSGQTVSVPGTTATIDMTLPGMTLVDVTAATGTVVLTLNNPVIGHEYFFEVLQGATARNMTFPSNTLQRGGGGRTYTASGANAKDVIRVVYDGTNYLISMEAAYA